jgi:hypothetical protein
MVPPNTSINRPPLRVLKGLRETRHKTITTLLHDYKFANWALPLRYRVKRTSIGQVTGLRRMLDSGATEQGIQTF